MKILDSYNSRMEKEGKEEQIITYTDIVGTLMSSVTNIVDIISYVLIAFVAISLVVSSNYDRGYHLHQCTGTEEGDWNPARDRGI